MDILKNESDIEREIYFASDKDGDLRLRQLFKLLTSIDDETIIEGVIRVFENTSRPDNKFRDQEFAGRVLEIAKPKSNVDLETFIKRTITNWDKSVEQLPFWFRDNYGLSNVKEIFDRLELTTDDMDKLETMRWWLKLKAHA